MATNKPTDYDIEAINARVSIAQAKLQATMRSFLPPPSKEDLDPEGKARHEREEEEAFRPEVEPTDRKAGILGNSQQIDANEQLRKLFLKKGKAGNNRGPERKLNGLNGTKRVLQPGNVDTLRRGIPVEDEEEVGRSGLVSAKRQGRSMEDARLEDPGDDVGKKQHALPRDGATKGNSTKRSLSYLDQVLIEKERKKKKRKEKKQEI